MKTFYRKLKNSGEPKYLQIYQAIVESIREGLLKSGDRLPASRELARLYKCHRLTVMNAMQALAAEGWIESQERSHYFVSAKIPVVSSRPAIVPRNEVNDQAPVIEWVRPAPTPEPSPKSFRLAFWGWTAGLAAVPAARI